MTLRHSPLCIQDSECHVQYFSDFCQDWWLLCWKRKFYRIDRRCNEVLAMLCLYHFSWMWPFSARGVVESLIWMSKQSNTGTSECIYSGWLLESAVSPLLEWGALFLSADYGLWLLNITDFFIWLVNLILFHFGTVLLTSSGLQLLSSCHQKLMVCLCKELKYPVVPW